MPNRHGPSFPPRRLLSVPWPALLAALAVALVSVVAAPSLVRAFQPQRIVRVHGVGAGTIVLNTREKTLGAALAKAGVELGAKDQITPELSRPLADETEVRIRPAVPVQVQVNGQELDWLTAAPTVGDLLAELGLRLGEKDRVEPGPTAPLVVNQPVRVIRVAEQMVTEERTLAYDTVKRADGGLLAGETRELREGEAGLAEAVFREVREDGQLVSRELVAEKVIRAPTDRIVAYGTAGVVSRSGVSYRYRQELTMTATGYSPGDGMTPGNYTATGMLAKRGVVAVDPRVIPLGTRVYVEGYGPAVAADTGGAIKGMRIDLCFDSVPEALSFGLQNGIKVYVLD